MAKGRQDANGGGFLRGGARAGKTLDLSRALRSKIGRVCWFQHPETGQIIEGTYTRGRKVTQLTGMSRLAETPDGARGFNLNETIWSVPRRVRITMGQAPAAMKGTK
jgi:hypothetical protein